MASLVVCATWTLRSTSLSPTATPGIRTPSTEIVTTIRPLELCCVVAGLWASTALVEQRRNTNTAIAGAIRNGRPSYRKHEDHPHPLLTLTLVRPSVVERIGLTSSN